MNDTDDNLAGEGPTPVTHFPAIDLTKTYAIVANSFDHHKWPIGCIWLHGPELLQQTQWRDLIDIGQVYYCPQLSSHSLYLHIPASIIEDQLRIAPSEPDHITGGPPHQVPYPHLFRNSENFANLRTSSDSPSYIYPILHPLGFSNNGRQGLVRLLYHLARSERDVYDVLYHPPQTSIFAQAYLISGDDLDDNAQWNLVRRWSNLRR
ncbi:hypothetical protein QBC41DRAFT_305000 [Cercophora samala]|uniref:Uncharacterized protein n=1 Tax=Cercophora samala TaxID=330535 RepID=A0AA39ZAE9_9PEZI|nr:hypothetical protein QBC41DRAFT_305000 [Cercophora samala]